MSATTPAGMPEEIVTRLDRLEDRLEDVQAENDRLREDLNEKDQRIAELEARVDDLEDQPDVELRTDDEKPDLPDVWIGGLPVGTILNTTQTRSKDVLKRVEDLERGEADISELMGAPSESMLPIQRKTSERKSGVHDLGGNELRATYVWSELDEHARSEAGKIKLDSTQVRNIHKKHDLGTNSNTIRRTMRMVAKHTSRKDPKERDAEDEENLFRFVAASSNPTGSKNVLVAEADEWDDWVEQLRSTEDVEDDRPAATDTDAGTDADAVDADIDELTTNATPAEVSN